MVFNWRSPSLDTSSEILSQSSNNKIEIIIDSQRHLRTQAVCSWYFGTVKLGAQKILKHDFVLPFATSRIPRKFLVVKILDLFQLFTPDSARARPTRPLKVHLVYKPSQHPWRNRCLHSCSSEHRRGARPYAKPPDNEKKACRLSANGLTWSR